MKIQIQKTIGEHLGINPDKNGFYFCTDKKQMNVKMVVQLLQQKEIDTKILIQDQLKDRGYNIRII